MVQPLSSNSPYNIGDILDSLYHFLGSVVFALFVLSGGDVYSVAHI